MAGYPLAMTVDQVHLLKVIQHKKRKEKRKLLKCYHLEALVYFEKIQFKAINTYQVKLKLYLSYQYKLTKKNLADYWKQCEPLAPCPP